MDNENNELQKELEEMEREYEELQEELNAEIAASPTISDTGMHMFNISIAVIMIIIGAIFAHQTRHMTQKSGKKIAGWILLILGALTLITHVIQLIS